MMELYLHSLICLHGVVLKLSTGMILPFLSSDYTCWTPVTVIARIVGSNPTQGIDVCSVYAFILCLCCPVFR
jgi:hypothetical protein